MRASFAEEREAAEALLRTAVEVVKPALPLICTATKFFSEALISAAHLASACRMDRGGGECRGQLYVGLSGFLTESVHEFQGNCWALVEHKSISFKEASRAYDVEKVVATLLRLCAEAAGGNGPKRAAEARRRAERLRAVATLIDAVGGAK